MECEILDPYLSSRSLTCLLLNLSENIAMESLAAENDVSRDAEDQNNRHMTNSYPTEFSFPRHNSTYCGASKCLSQSDVKLRSFHSVYRVQVSSKIKTDRAYGSGVPYPDAHRICVISNELSNANRSVHVPTVIENRCAQSFLDTQRKTEF